MNNINIVDLKKIMTPKIGEDAINNWFANVILNMNENKIKLLFPSLFVKDWVSTHYLDEIEKCISSLLNSKDFVLCLDIHLAQTEVTNTQEIQPNKNFLHTFDNFVIGRSNEMAYTAAVKICENIQHKPIFNPLFFYGEPGVGKSHLLSAINAKVYEIDPTINLIYMTAEQFMIRFITSLKENTIMQFKEELRMAKFFLIDDVQFMMGKESTQEEFFHTFNFLIEKGCQIILSSDKSPNHLEGLEDRLRSRLGAGLTVQIHNPNYELRLSILTTKAQEGGVNVSQEVLNFLAENLKGTLRDLEGAWTRLSTHSVWMNVPITMDLVYQILQDTLSTYERKISIKDIQCAVGNFYSFPLNDMLADKREKRLTRARHVAMFLSRQLTTSSSGEIGFAFGGKDHSTILYAVDKIEKERKKDFNLANEIDIISKQLKKAI